MMRRVALGAAAVAAVGLAAGSTGCGSESKEKPSVEKSVSKKRQVQILRKEKRVLQNRLDKLGRYEAPTFVFEKTVLKPGESQTGVLPQRPIKLPDGKVENDKAIVVRRGDWVSETQFVPSAQGKFFMITFLRDGRPRGRGSGILLKEGFGCAINCRDPDNTKFNCYFKTTLEPDGGVKVRWTMFHSVHGKRIHGGHVG